MSCSGTLILYGSNLFFRPILPEPTNLAELALNFSGLPESTFAWSIINTGSFFATIEANIRSPSNMLGLGAATIHQTTFDRPASNAHFIRSSSPDNELEYRRLGQKVEELRYLPRNWNGYDGVAASARTVFEARHVLGLVPNRFRVPHVMSASNGDVAFFWERGSKYLEIGFEGNGAYYYFSDGLDQDVQADSCSVATTALPSDLLAALETIA
jgi:hypothetical protein